MISKSLATMLNKFRSDFLLVPKWTKIGVIGVVFMYASVAGLTSAAIPWWIGKGDSALHIDQALSVYHRKLPRYHEYVQYKVFHQLGPGYKTQDQRAAANPPLFYMLHAPIVGPLLDAGHWKKAIALGRAFNVFLGVLAVLAMAWAGWLFGGKRKQLFAVAVPAVGSLSYVFSSLNHNYALDVLVVLFGVLTTVVWYKLLENGLKPRFVVALFALTVLGMATKASYIIFFALSILAVMITAFIHVKGKHLKKLFVGSLIAGALLITVLISIGWYYYNWNYKTSGMWYTARLPGDFSSREYKSLSVVLTHPNFWASFYQRITSSAVLSTVITAVSAVGVALALSKTKWQKFIKNKTNIAIVLLLGLLFVGTIMTQIVHSVGVGNISFRYFLPSLLVFSLFISYGLLEIRKARGQLLSLALAGMSITSVVTIAKLKDTKDMVPAIRATDNILEKLTIALTNNGFPAILLPLILILLVSGMALTAYSLFKLTKQTR